MLKVKQFELQPNALINEYRKEQKKEIRIDRCMFIMKNKFDTTKIANLIIASELKLY